MFNQSIGVDRVSLKFGLVLSFLFLFLATTGGDAEAKSACKADWDELQSGTWKISNENSNLTLVAERLDGHRTKSFLSVLYRYTGKKGDIYEATVYLIDPFTNLSGQYRMVPLESDGSWVTPSGGMSLILNLCSQSELEIHRELNGLKATNLRGFHIKGERFQYQSANTFMRLGYRDYQIAERLLEIIPEPPATSGTPGAYSGEEGADRNPPNRVIRLGKDFNTFLGDFNYFDLLDSYAEDRFPQFGLLFPRARDASERLARQPQAIVLALNGGEGVEKLILIQSDSRVGRGSTALILEVVNR